MYRSRNILLIGVLILQYIGVDSLIKEHYFDLQNDNESATCVGNSRNIFKQIIDKYYKPNIKSCDRNLKGKLHCII